MKENKQAISLIVLVITIIVMIILAGAIILTLNNSGIISKAQDAVKQTNEATAKEVASLAWAEAYAEGKREQEDLETAVMSALEEAKVDTEEYYINVTTGGVSLYRSVIAIVDGVPIPKGFVASSATGENLKSKGLVIYEGSGAVTDANVEAARRERNQYVWVPVDTATFGTTFVRNEFTGSSGGIVVDTSGNYYPIGSNSGVYWEVQPTTELSEANLQYMTKETLKEVQAMYASVKKYGGFYIGRYEAGVDVQRTSLGTAEELPGIKERTSVYSVMGKIPYTYIPWTWNNVMNEDTNGAVEVARNMYPENSSNYGVVSTLTYGVQWDRTLQWFIDTGVMTLNQVNTTEGSTKFGNYSDHVINTADELNDGAQVWDYTASSSGSYVAKESSTLTYPKASGTNWALSTGALKAANINNIYDMAGNMQEWTMEGIYVEYRSWRGGIFRLNGNSYTIARRSSDSPNNPYNVSSGGFRSALYIK